MFAFICYLSLSICLYPHYFSSPFRRRRPPRAGSFSNYCKAYTIIRNLKFKCIEQALTIAGRITPQSIWIFTFPAKSRK